MATQTILHRDKKQKISGKQEKEEDGAESIFECPVCYETTLPPIYQCTNGHLVCSSCKTKVTQCPTCRGSLGGESGIRSLALETLASKMVFPCRYKEIGCTETILFLDKKKHENEECKYRPFRCCIYSCTWEGEGLKDHFVGEHKFIALELKGLGQRQKFRFVIADKKCNDDKIWGQLYSLKSHTLRDFLFFAYIRRTKATDEYQFFVQHINDERLYYTIEVSGKERTYSYTALTRSIRENLQVVSSKDCLIIPSNIVEFLAEDSILAVDFVLKAPRTN